MAEWKVSRPTLLIPYGVRSFLESVCRAYRIEDPRDIRQFLADYCKDLLENRDRSPSKDLKQAIRIYQKMRERDQVTIKSWSPQDSPNEPITPSPFGEQAEICEDDDEDEDEEDDEDERSCPAVSVSIVSCRLTHDAWKNCETMYDDQAPLESPGPVSSGDIPAARVLSAVFRKVPSRSDSFTETQGAVLIDSASAPPDDVIVVHSENLPNAIVFHVDSHPSSASSVRSCASKTQSLTDAKVTEECGVEVAQDPVVVFERVLFTDEYQSSSLVERDEPQSLEVTDQPLTSVEGDQSSGTPLGMESDVQTLTAPVVVKQASPKRSLVRVYSAHLVNPEDRKGSSQPDKKPSPAPSSKTSLTDTPETAESVMERVSTANTEEREEPVCQEASQDGLGRVSPATSPILMEATGFADAQEQVVDASQTAPPVETAAHATSPIEKYTLIGCQLYDECLDAAVGMITKDSSHSSPVPGDETGHGVYLETDTVTGATEEDDFVWLHLPSPPPDTPQDNSVDSPPLAESLQTATMAFESATPDVIVESEETVAHEQSANTAEASDISAESPAFTTAESTEIGINTMECCPSEASQDASSLETMADCAAVSPVTHVEPELYSSPDDATSPSDGACTPTTDTEAVTVSCVHHVDDNVTDTEKTAAVMTSVDSSKTPVSPDVIHETCECLRSSPIPEAMAQLDCSRNTCTECPETQASPSEPVGVASPECVVEPPRRPAQENTIESVAEDDSGYIAESISDNSEPSDIKEDQVAKKEASSTLEELECTILPSPADEDIAATAYCPFSVKENSVETATQKPSATEVALSATPPPAEIQQPLVLSKGPDSDNRAECSETAESAGLQVDVVEPVSARYSACKITQLLTSEPVEDYGQKSVPLVSTPSEERMSGTGPASPTMEPVVAHMLSPCSISGSDEPEVCEVESRLPGSTGLGIEEEPAVEKPAEDEALSATPAIPASPPVMAHLPVECPCKSPIQKLFEDLKIAEIVVPEQTEFVSAEGVVEAGQASPDRLSQEAVPGNKVDDDVRVVMEAPVPAPAAAPVEPLPRPAVTSDSFEALMSSESCARVISPMLEHTMILKSLVANSVQRNSVSIPAPAERAMSPALSRKGSAMSGSVSVHNQFSGLALGQSAAGGEERPQRYSLDSSNITWPPAASPSNNVANGSIQDNAQQDNNDNTTGQRGRGSPSNNDSVIQSSVNQMWTLFHLPHVSEDGTFSTEILTQPPFNGSAYIRSFGPGHVLLAKRSPTPSQDDLRTATGGTPEHLTQASNLQYQEHHPHNQQRPLHDVGPAVKDATEFLQPTSPSGEGTLEISLPNFLLCIDNGQQATPLMGSSLPVPAQAVRVRRDEASGLLAFTVPMESVSSSQSRKRQVQFLPITTEQGQSVYSPAVLRIVTHPPDQPPK